MPKSMANQLFNTKFIIDDVPVDISDLTIARHHIINEALNLPPARGDYLRYAILFYLLKDKQRPEELDFDSICQELKLGNDEKRHRRAQKYVDRSIEEGLIEEDDVKYKVSDRYKSNWSRIEKLVTTIGVDLIVELKSMS
jgi:hypothetical protein